MADEAENKLKKIILDRIAAQGPLTVDEYMRICLFDEEHGYYVKQMPFGRAGDFITAPEISQMFGEMLALWCLDVWQRLGEPDPCYLVELGPGRGTLMDDILRGLNCSQKFQTVLNVILVEASAKLQTAQRDKLKQHKVKISWREDISALPDGPTIILANEFLDALPIKQAVYVNGEWCERSISCDEDGQFVWVEMPLQVSLNVRPPADKPPKSDDILEWSDMQQDLVATISKHIEKHAGAALFIDYGYSQRAYGDSLQAVRDHSYVNVFDSPGYSDLTSHVDFQSLKSISQVNGANVFGPIAQGEFLINLGLGVRAKNLVDKNPENANQIEIDFHRLVSPQQMGNLFKVLAISSSSITVAPFG